MMSGLRAMSVMAGMDPPPRGIRERIAWAISVVARRERCREGARRITHVTECVGLDQDGRLILEDIFKYQQRGIDSEGKIQGAVVLTGYIPSFIPDLLNQGIITDDGSFL